MSGADELRIGRATLPAGTFHLAEPFDRAWTLTVDGEEVIGRPAFGATIAYDVERAGEATLAYETSVSRGWIVVAQAIAWVLVFLAAINVRVPRLPRRRARSGERDLPLIALQDPEPLLTPDGGGGGARPGVAAEAAAISDDDDDAWGPLHFADDPSPVDGDTLATPTPTSPAPSPTSTSPASASPAPTSTSPAPTSPANDRGGS
jgi:hypothetical protein